MARRRAIALSGLAAAALVNYWILAPIIGVDHDPGFSWISDLAARGEAGGWRFALLDGLSGFAVVCFGALLWRAPARPADGCTGVSRSHILDSGSPVAGTPGGDGALRWGLILLIASGALAIADALLPVSCARSLGAGCIRAGDLVDELHEIESALAVLATGAAMVLVGIGVRRQGGARWLVALSLLAGVAFLLLSGLISIRGSVEAFNECKGWLQRGGQLVFGTWLAALALAFRSAASNGG